jgi:hypothetical protein
MNGFFPLVTKGREDKAMKRSRIWFDDGSTILQAEDTQFCVHKSVILKHFPTLNDFVPSQSPGLPSSDGCAIIDLSDSAKDWESLLIMIYDHLP